MDVIKVAVSDLSLDPSNARKHPEKNLEAIKGSLRRFGQQKPLVIDRNNVVIAGNGTLMAAKALGWSEIDVVKSDLQSVEAVAFGLADNRTSELAEWDTEILDKYLKELDLADVGFEFNPFPEENLDDLPDKDKDKKYLLELEFPDEQAMKDEYEKLCSQGLIVRIK